MRSLIILFAFCQAVLISGAGDATALDVNTVQGVERMLNSVPEQLNVFESPLFKGYQDNIHIPRNIERLYGVGSVVEFPNYGIDRPSESTCDLDCAPLKVTEDTTLREFLDNICSTGRFTWGIVQGAIHLQPISPQAEKENYLDNIRVSLDLQNASIMDAAKAWANAVNKNKPEGTLGVAIRHTSVRPGLDGVCHTTPASLTRSDAITLKLEDVTAREALCAIQSVSKEWLRITYHNLNTTKDCVMFFASKSEQTTCPVISTEERDALNEQEGLLAINKGEETAVKE